MQQACVVLVSRTPALCNGHGEDMGANTDPSVFPKLETHGIYTIKARKGTATAQQELQRNDQRRIKPKPERKGGRPPRSLFPACLNQVAADIKVQSEHQSQTKQAACPISLKLQSSSFARLSLGPWGKTSRRSAVCRKILAQLEADSPFRNQGPD